MYRSHRMKVVVSRASHVHHMPQAGLPHNGPVRIGVGRIAKDSPSLRTGQAGHPHPALQSVVLPPRGLTNLCMGNCQGEQPMLGKESIHLPPLTPCLRAVNIRSVQTSGSTQAHWARISPACLVLSDTVAGFASVCLPVTFPPSCAPSLQARYGLSLLL